MTDDEAILETLGGPGAASVMEHNIIQTQGSEKPYLAGFTINSDGTKSQILIPVENSDVRIEWRKRMKAGEAHMVKGEWGEASDVFQTILDSSYFYSKIPSSSKYDLHISFAYSSLAVLESGVGWVDVSYTKMSLLLSIALRADPWEAYYGLGQLSVLEGNLEEALSHFKNSLYHSSSGGGVAKGATSSAVPSLLSVGAIYVLLGDLNTGRHYLSRAVSQWEGEGSNMVALMKAKAEMKTEKAGAWMVDFCLKAFKIQPVWNAVGAGERGGVTEESSDFAMLSYLLSSIQTFTTRMHCDLGLAMWELGAVEVGDVHVKEFGVDRMEGGGGRRAEERDNVIRWRAALNVPLVGLGAGNWEDIVVRLMEIAGREISSVPVDELQYAVETLPLLFYEHGGEWSEYGLVERYLREANNVLGKVSPFLDLEGIVDEGGGRIVNGGEGREKIRIGVISAYFCSHPVGRLSLPMIASFPRDKFRVTVFSFPTKVDSWAQAIAWSADNYVGLSNDFVKASEKIAAANLDILLFPDHSDPISCLLSYQRLAPVQAGYFVRGAVVGSGLGEMDYYIMPEVGMGRDGGNAGGGGGQQTVVLSGLGLPFDPPQEAEEAKSEFGGRRFYSNENIYLVLTSVPPAIGLREDSILRQIIALDSNALVVLVPDVAEMSMWSSPTSEVAYRLGPRLWCQRLLTRIKSGAALEDRDRILLLKPLPVEERTGLIKISEAVLDFGGSITAVEAMALRVPVVCEDHRGVGGIGCGVNKRLGGIVEDLCVADEGGEGMAKKAVRIGTDAKVRGEVIKGIDRAIEGGELADVMQTIGSTEGGQELAEFLEKVGGPWAELRREVMRGRRKK